MVKMMREIRAARIILYANRRDELGNHHHIMWVMVGNVAACKNDDDDERYKSGNLSNYYSSLFLFLRMWSFSCRWLSHANPPIVVVANSFLYERERGDQRRGAFFLFSSPFLLRSSCIHLCQKGERMLPPRRGRDVLPNYLLPTDVCHQRQLRHLFLGVIVM